MKKFRKTAAAKIGSWILALAMVVTSIAVPDVAAYAGEGVSVNSITVKKDDTTLSDNEIISVEKGKSVTLSYSVSINGVSANDVTVSANSANDDYVTASVDVSANSIVINGAKATLAGASVKVTVTASEKGNSSNKAEIAFRVKVQGGGSTPAKEVTGIRLTPETVDVVKGANDPVDVIAEVLGTGLSANDMGVTVSVNSAGKDKVTATSAPTTSGNTIIKIKASEVVEGAKVIVTSKFDNTKTAEIAVNVTDNAPVANADYYLVGPLVGKDMWNTTDYGFVSDGENIYTVTVSDVKAGTYEYHVLKAKAEGDGTVPDWTQKYHEDGFHPDSSGNLSITVPEKQDITFTLDVTDADAPVLSNNVISTTTPVPDSIEVTPASVTVKEKETTQLTAKVKDVSGNEMADETVVFASNNTAVATVDADGKVTGVKAGETTITVTCNSDSTIKKEVQVEVTSATTQTQQTTQTQTPAVTTPKATGTAITTAKDGNYKVTNGTSGAAEVAITAPASKTAKSVTIPATITIDGVEYKVTSVADKAFKGMKSLQKVTFGKNITKIGKSAFSGCTKLKTVKMNTALVEIGDSAFSGCTKLASVTIPKNVKTIGKKAFYNCKALKKVTVKSTVLKKVGSSAFKKIKSGATIKVPKKTKAKATKLLKSKVASGTKIK